MFDLEPMITLPWLVRLRWLFVIGQLLVFAVVRFGVGAELPWWPFAMAVGVTAISNVAIASKRSHRWPPAVRMGSVLLLDTVLLTVELSGLGGATNPFTVMYLVYITLSAVVLSARWTSLVAVLAIACFALLFAVPAETHVHHSGPPLLNPHLQGMWAAFVIAAVLMGFFVRKISRAIAMQREEIASLRETAARNARLASLATLAAGAAHELNTPLSTIAVAAHEACVRAKQLADGTSVAADLDLILEQVDRCQRIIHQMAARATSTDREDVISLDELVGELRQQLGTRATAVDVELSGAPREDVAAGLARRAVARRAGQECARREQAGRPRPDRDQARAHRGVVRGARPRGRDPTGRAGACRRSVLHDQAGGKWARARRVPRPGVLRESRWRAVDRIDARGRDAGSRANPTRLMTTTSILIVDDDGPLRSRLARAFADRGFDVVEAADHAEALAVAGSRKLARAVVDLRMPGPSGLAVVQDLLGVQSDLQIVVVTGYGSIATAVEAMRLGAHDYLTKPANADQILAAFDADPEAPPSEPEYDVPSLAKVEREHIERVLQECNGNISKAARKLGMHRRTLQYKLAKFPVKR
jgi:ActR/RegA family two-component response regulator/signal transduction histidine kinase